jgi:UDP-glucose 4-epimerase
MIPYDQVYGQGIEDMLHRAPSIEKITKAIGWQPTRSLDEVLEDVVEFVRRAPLPVDTALLEG